MAKQVFDFRPGKGFTVAQSNEHQRRWTEKGWQSATHSGTMTAHGLLSTLK